MGGFGKGGELSAAQLEALDATTLALSVPSALAALAIIASYWRYSELRSHAFSLVHWLAVADLLNALWPFVPRDPAAACSFQAFINQTFSLASILWTAAIAHTLYATVVQRAQRVEKYMRSYHIAIWALSLLSAVVPLAAGRFASVGPWCWIATAPSGDKGGAAMRFAFFYAPLWLVILYQIFVYFAVVRTLHLLSRMKAAADGSRVASDDDAMASPSTRQRSRLWAIVAKLGYYPAILIFVHSFATVHRIVNAVSGKTIFWLYMLQAIFVAMQGLFHAFAYGLNPAVRARAAGAMLVCCGSDCGLGSGTAAHTRLDDDNEEPGGTAGSLPGDDYVTDDNVAGDIDDLNSTIERGGTELEMVEVKLDSPTS